jgi:hypothetical protein
MMEMNIIDVDLMAQSCFFNDLEIEFIMEESL